MSVTLETMVQLAKKRGFVFPSSEIYGGFSAIYDYGSLGVELASNIKNFWWKTMVQMREDIVGLDSSIFMHPRVWEASGHVSGFSDPLAECKKCHTRSRVDHLLEDIGVSADEKMSEQEIQNLFNDHIAQINCTKCGSSDFSQAHKFNLLVKANLGNFTNDWTKEPAYLRGETCQGIYINFKNVLDSTHIKIPFGIAQIGKAFRNEITARQFIFRTREFEQMEMQYFTRPEDEMVLYEVLREARFQYYIDLGIDPKNLQWHKHDRLVFYAKQAYDIEYNFPFGFKELEGIHARGDYDLSQHMKFSGQDLTYFDEEKKEHYTPHIIESSVGVGRTLLAVLCDAYYEEEVRGETRVVLKLKPMLAPFKIAVLPLSKKLELTSVAREIASLLRPYWMIDYDETQSIGKRYRRQDEIGTPYCVTIDFESLNDKCITIRDRDTMQQDRIHKDELVSYFKEKLSMCH
ncbi:glycine--tRNA ligase [Candidatus Uhrbacteria bacterium CG_4_9_14_3_um_filter_36_7]|uniref:Glycine--tRNA ligase n=1 Tax=Candidatus Uhrbacteria bacterium CG_4_9_14_3_um_filter_36_7 TaxID=1975033 RepID=A0A2M7XHR6_9BACT|nr:MAG: glycine--tRNA ligase [Candidatus Uhrbacteria bacterium CG_4_9_14_3_um_filter_36_7]